LRFSELLLIIGGVAVSLIPDGAKPASSRSFSQPLYR
jgi:hypothetical protein